MGQYYKVVFLGYEPTVNKKETIRLWLCPHRYGEGLKILEHSRVGSLFMNVIDEMLSVNGAFYKSRMVWAGDYSKKEKYSDKNLYNEQDDGDHVSKIKLFNNDCNFITNHSKKQYIMNPGKGFNHPLPLLTCEGGCNADDIDEKWVGFWSRDIISNESEAIEGYELIEIGKYKSY